MQHTGKLGIAALILGFAAAYMYSRNAGASETYIQHDEYQPSLDPIFHVEHYGAMPFADIPSYMADDFVPPANDQQPGFWSDWTNVFNLPGQSSPGAFDSDGMPVIEGNPMDNVIAFLNVIGQHESNNDYNKLYGGESFSDFSKHPNRRIPFYNPKTKKNDISTAAGKYQINKPTYDEFSRKLGITDFSPASQDAIAIELLKVTGAYNAIIQGDIQLAFQLASKRWASLPGSTSGQKQVSMTTALNDFANYGGTA